MLGPLLDRIEVINVPAYLPVEKMNIAKNYLIPKFEEEYGFNKEEVINLTDAAIIEIINSYCGHEAGIRNLRKSIDRVFRKITAKLEMIKDEKADETVEVVEATIAEEEDGVREYQVNTKNLERFLDIP